MSSLVGRPSHSRMGFLPPWMSWLLEFPCGSLNYLSTILMNWPLIYQLLSLFSKATLMVGVSFSEKVISFTTDLTKACGQSILFSDVNLWINSACRASSTLLRLSLAPRIFSIVSSVKGVRPVIILKSSSSLQAVSATGQSRILCLMLSLVSRQLRHVFWT